MSQKIREMKIKLVKWNRSRPEEEEEEEEYSRRLQYIEILKITETETKKGSRNRSSKMNKVVVKWINKKITENKDEENKKNMQNCDLFAS